MYGDSFKESREQRMSFAQNKCETCKHDGTKYQLECHHASAEAYWLDEREELTMTDVVILCKECHDTLTAKNWNERFDKEKIKVDKALEAAMDILAQQRRGKYDFEIETGFNDLDRNCGGLQRQELAFLLGRPSVGKTSFALNVVRSALNQEKPTLFVSLESNPVRVAQRIGCIIGDVNGQRVRNGTSSQSDVKNLVKAAGEIAGTPMYVECGAKNTFELFRIVRSLKKEANLQFVVIDYLEMIQPDRRYRSREEQADTLVRQLKSLARETNVAVLCLSMLKEPPSSYRGRQAFVCEHGIREHADLVMRLDRRFSEELYSEEDETIAELAITKNRCGPVAEVCLKFDPVTGRFLSREPERYSEFDEFPTPKSF
jgi:replicative DNA helicase